MTLKLNDHEARLLAQLVERELSDLPSEIRRTQTTTLREELKEERQALRSIHERLVVASQTK